MSPQFEPALQLNAAFYSEVVAPLLGDVPHAAARVGWGSEVLGFDTERSTDHGWGPQLQIFVAGEAVDDVRRVIDASLPETFRGWPVRYGWDDTAVDHRVNVTTLGEWFTRRLGVDPANGLSATDWLLIPQQRLLEETSGAVFHDGSGELSRVRQELAWYPDDVWLWMIACQWQRISQEEAFVGRSAEVGDELGSQIVASRLARELMRLWFLFSRAYWPYSKWFGSGFARLPDSAALGRSLSDAIAARDYPAREDGLVAAYILVAERHNAIGLTEPVDPSTRLFYGRPFEVLMAERFVAACLEKLADSPLKKLPLVGSIDQAADSTDVLERPEFVRRLSGN